MERRTTGEPPSISRLISLSLTLLSSLSPAASQHIEYAVGVDAHHRTERQEEVGRAGALRRDLHHSERPLQARLLPLARLQIDLRQPDGQGEEVRYLSHLP